MLVDAECVLIIHVIVRAGPGEIIEDVMRRVRLRCVVGHDGCHDIAGGEDMMEWDKKGEWYPRGCRYCKYPDRDHHFAAHQASCSFTCVQIRQYYSIYNS